MVMAKSFIRQEIDERRNVAKKPAHNGRIKIHEKRALKKAEKKDRRIE